MDKINKSSVYSYTPGLSGCGCGSRRYYTKAEIDEMLQNVIDEDKITEILDQMFEEYIEEGDLYELILSVVGDIYTKDEIDTILADYATKTWVQSQGYLTQHQDISGKVDKTDFNSFTAETSQCCEYVRGELADIWDAIAALTGDTPTPPTPGPDTGSTQTGSTIYITYSVTSTTVPTKIMNQSEVESQYSRVYLSDGYEITKSTGYTFEETGLQVLRYEFAPDPEIPTDYNTLYWDRVTSNAWVGINTIVDVTVGGDTRLFYGYRFLNDCVNLTGITVSSNSRLFAFYGPSGCTSLENVDIPANTPLEQFGGIVSCPLVTSISIPDSVKLIRYMSLNNTGISIVQLPYGLLQIGGSCFSGNTSLSSIYFTSLTPPSLIEETTSLGETSKTFPIYVPAESVTDYKRSSYYQHYAYRIEAMPNE